MKNRNTTSPGSTIGANMSSAAEAPAFSALAEGIALLQSKLVAAGLPSEDLHIRIPPPLGECIEAELCHADPQSWRPLTPGIEILADGHLKQFTLCETIRVGWRLGTRKERKPHYGQPYGAPRDGG